MRDVHRRLAGGRDAVDVDGLVAGNTLLTLTGLGYGAVRSFQRVSMDLDAARSALAGEIMTAQAFSATKRTRSSFAFAEGLQPRVDVLADPEIHVRTHLADDGLTEELLGATCKICLADHALRRDQVFFRIFARIILAAFSFAIYIGHHEVVTTLRP